MQGQPLNSRLPRLRNLHATLTALALIGVLAALSTASHAIAQPAAIPSGQPTPAPSTRPAGTPPLFITDVKPPFKFEIRVLDPDDKPLPDVQVRCLHPRPQRSKPIVDLVSRTDASGVARFEATQADFLTDRHYWFLLQGDNIVHGGNRVGMSPIDRVFTYTLRALPAKPCPIHVQNEQGKPISNASLTLFPDGPSANNGYDAQGRTNAQGHATISGPAQGQIGICAVAPGYASTTLRGLTLSPDQPYTLTLSPGQDITGEIRNKQDQPLAGIAVTAIKRDLYHYADEFHLKATTDKDGKFILKNASKGTWWIGGRSAPTGVPYAVPLTKVEVADGPATDLSIEALPSFRLRGKYVTPYKVNTMTMGDSTLPEITFFSHVFRFPDGASPRLTSLHPDADGQFEISGVACAGRGEITFEGVGGYWHFIKMPNRPFFQATAAGTIVSNNVPPGVYDGVEIHYLLAGILRGQVVDAAGKPLARQRVLITPGGGIHDLDQNGRFSVQVPPVDGVKCQLWKDREGPVLTFAPVLSIKEGQIVEQTFVVPEGAKID
ncbi:MAG: MSCRAMM family protein [Bacillota bacterium]